MERDISKRNDEYDDNYILVDAYPDRAPGEEIPRFTEVSSVANPYARRRFIKAPDGTRGALSGYLPNKKRISEATLRHSPRYWHRAVHKSSRGRNSEGHYQSQAMYGGLGASDFFELTNDQIRDSLYAHVSQTNCSSHWISFTDSFVTAMGRANQFMQKGKAKVEIHTIDTFNIKNLPLMVHSYAMLRGYRVCVNEAEEHQKKLLGSSYAEFLVWDQLVAEASSVSVKSLYKAGLLNLMPELVYPPDDKLTEKRKFKQPGVLRHQLYKVELHLKKQELFRDQYYSGPYNKLKVRVPGRFPLRKKDLLPVSIRGQKKDPRGPIGIFEMEKWKALAMCVRHTRFQLVFLIALLSMKTNTYCRDSIAGQLHMSIELSQYKSDYLEFSRTPANTPEKRDVQVFQELFTELMSLKGRRVTYVHQVKRIMTLLDRDPKVVLAEPELSKGKISEARIESQDECERHGLLTVDFLEACDDVPQTCTASETIVQEEEGRLQEEIRLKERHREFVSMSPTTSLKFRLDSSDTKILKRKMRSDREQGTKRQKQALEMVEARHRQRQGDQIRQALGLKRLHWMT